VSKIASLAAAVALLSSTQLTAAAPPNKSAAPGALIVVDANGKVVGRYDGTPVSMGSVYLSINGVLTSLVLGGSSYGGMYLGLPGSTIYYAAPDCTGPAYAMLENRNPGVRISVLQKNGQQILAYTAVNYSFVVVSLQSYYSNGTCVYDPFTTTSVQLGAPVDITGQFTEPLHID
jgi:hypothetical protein